MSNSLYPVSREPATYRESSTLTKLLAVLLLLVAGALVFTVIQNRRAQHNVVSFEPRPIAQRPDDKLGADEQATIDVFGKFSRSVVHVTSLATRRDQITMDVTQIPQFSTTQVAQLTTTNLSAMTATQLNAFSVTQLDNFSNDQLEAYLVQINT